MQKRLQRLQHFAQIEKPEGNKMTELVTNKYGETFKKVALKSLKKGDEFKRQPDALKSFYKWHYNRKSACYKQATFCCIPDDDVFGGGMEINAKAFVYVDSAGPANYKGLL